MMMMMIVIIIIIIIIIIIRLTREKMTMGEYGGNWARPNRRNEGSGGSAQGMFLGVPQTRRSDFTIEHLKQSVFLDRIRFEQRMNFDRVRSAYIVPLSIF